MNINKAPAISIYTFAFNVENYIRECAESVLQQTFTDFEWIILDNGCTDKTSEILEEYARKDSRIRLFRNQKNSFLHNEPLNPDFVRYGENLASEYWCVVDSDDYLHPDFMMELYTAAKEHDADIAVGGTEMFKDENVQIRGTRCPPDFYTGDLTSLGDMLPQIYGCFRPMWGKLIKVSIVKRHLEYRKRYPLNLSNGADTVFNLDCLRFSNSVVGINKVLYYYRIRNTSYYHSQVNKNRYLDYKIIYDESKKLLQHWNKLNDTTLDFIARVLYSSIKDCINIAAEAVSIPPRERMDVIETICNDQSVYHILDERGLSANLFVDTQKCAEKIMEDLEEADLPVAISHYIYRLFTSIKMANSTLLNKQNAFLLYLSSLCDETNKNRFGSVLLYSFFTFVGKTMLAEFEQSGIKSDFLASNHVLLRELVNSRFDHAVKICEEHSGDTNYDLLKQELQRKRWHVNIEPIHHVKNIIEKCMYDGNVEEAIDLLVTVLDHCPLDREALCYKLYLLTLHGDMWTALETAEALRVFYPDDSTAMTLVAQAFAYAGQKERAREAFEKALNVCVDDTKRIEIARELETINNS